MADRRETQGSVVIRELAPDDAEGLVRCCERCYGDSYVNESFYDPAAIRSRVADGRLRSVVAVGPDGEIVGHMGLSRRHPGGATADAGNTMVDPSQRGQNLAAHLGARLLEVAREADLVGFHHYPTTAHPVLQKLAVLGGGTETGIMLSYIPADTNYRGMAEGAGRERLAAVIAYQPLATAPEREVFLPARHGEPLRSLYEQMELRRRVAAAAAPAAGASTELDAELDRRRGLLRVRVSAVGADLRAHVDRVAAGTSAHVTQLDLSLSDSGVSWAVEELRADGFFYCGLLPEYFDGDVLRLQRLPDAVGELRAALATSEARALLDLIEADR